MSTQRNKKLKNIALVLGAAYVGTKLLQDSGDRSANVFLPDTSNTGAVTPESVAMALVNNPDTLIKIKGRSGSDGSGLSKLLADSVAAPADLTSLAVGNTVRSEDDLTTYLVIKKPVAETEDLEDSEYFKVIHGPYYAGPKGEPFTYADFTPEQLTELKVPGINGLNSPTWGGSIARSSALEEGTEGWLDGSTVSIPGASYKGLKNGVINGSNKTAIGSVCYINPAYLYKIELNYKANGSTAVVGVFGLNIAEGMVSKSTGTSSASAKTLTQEDSFKREIMYVGGTGSLSQNFADGVVKGALEIKTGALTTELIFNSLTLTCVSLGEPVPDNLPYLPTGQMVYDAVTGEIGRYNGTTVVWATA